MVIRDLNVVGIAFGEMKTNAPLLVDGYRVLSFSIPFQGMKAITWGHLQVI